MKVHQTSDHGCRRRSILNLAGFLARSAVNGPVSGPLSGCRGAQSTVKGVSTRRSGHFLRPLWFLQTRSSAGFLAIKDIDGVTFSGRRALFPGQKHLHRWESRSGKGGGTIVTYTGYIVRTVLFPVRLILPGTGCFRVTDLLIAGPYIRTLACDDPYIGSSNQQSHFPDRKSPNGCPARTGTR